MRQTGGRAFSLVVQECYTCGRLWVGKDAFSGILNDGRSHHCAGPVHRVHPWPALEAAFALGGLEALPPLLTPRVRALRKHHKDDYTWVKGPGGVRQWKWQARKPFT